MPAFPTPSILAFIAVTTFSMHVPAHAQTARFAPTSQTQPSDASAMSGLTIGVLSAAPIAIVTSGANLSVRAVEASADGTTWVLERAGDGLRASVKLAGNASVAVGTSVVVTSVAAGTVLSVAGKAIAFIPNEIGAALLHNERVTR